MKAIIFDFDGVIVDSEPLWDKYLLETTMKSFPGLTNEAFANLTGLSVPEGYAYLSGHFTPAMDLETYIAETNEFIPKIYDSSPLEAGVENSLKDIQQKNLRLSVASSSHGDWVKPSLKQHGLRGYFEYVSTVEEVEKGKPSPDLYLLAAKKLNLSPSDCVAIEDSKHGVAAARAAGIYCLGYIPKGRGSSLPEANEIITHHDQLSLVIDRLFR